MLSFYVHHPHMDRSPTSRITLHIAVDVDGVLMSWLDGVYSSEGETQFHQLLTGGRCQKKEEAKKKKNKRTQWWIQRGTQQAPFSLLINKKA